MQSEDGKNEGEGDWRDFASTKGHGHLLSHQCRVNFVMENPLIKVF
jgi:hypothetical protein